MTTLKTRLRYQAYYLANKARYRERYLEWKASLTPEEYKAINRKRYMKRRAASLAYRKRWRAANLERDKATKKAYRQTEYGKTMHKVYSKRSRNKRRDNYGKVQKETDSN